MLTLRHNIIFDHSVQLRNIISVSITKDVHALADTAIVTISAMHNNRTLEAEKRLAAGKPIRIALGYDEKLEVELEGYIERLESKEDTLRIHCTDAMHVFKQQVKAKSYTETTLSTILKELVTEVNTSLSPSAKIHVEIEQSFANISYTQYARRKGSAWDVFKKLKEALPVFTYMRGNTLYVQPPFSFDQNTRGKKVKYDFTKNIINSALRYKKTEDQLLQIILHSRNPVEDTPIEIVAGQAGGESLKLVNYNIVDQTVLKKLAEQALLKWQYDGYAGYIETFLKPYCTYGYTAILQDRTYPARTGAFFIEKVTTSFSASGGRREVYLSKKLATPIL